MIIPKTFKVVFMCWLKFSRWEFDLGMNTQNQKVTAFVKGGKLRHF
jgi:hypothetical protein